MPSIGLEISSRSSGFRNSTTSISLKGPVHTPTVLIVDDNEGLARLIEKALRRNGFSTAIAHSGEAAIAWLNGHSTDLMLLDLKLSDLHGKELIDRLEVLRCPIPFIVITGHGDERVAVEMMKLGAMDYLVKDAEFLQLVPSVVQRSMMHLDTERCLAEAEIERRRLEQEILGVSEREQRRVGQDLHDGLFQVLAATSMLAEVLKQRLAQSAVRDADIASTIADHAQRAVKLAQMLARGLSTVDVEANGLMHALKEMVDYTATLMRVECVFHCDEPVLVPDHTTSTHLYRIAQEAINNAIKHGNARRIDVALSKSDEMVELKIADDGVGFQPESHGKGGMGLHSMKYRADTIGARLEIHSASLRGTEVNCTFAPNLPLPLVAAPFLAKPLPET